jgi:hypothetical protein
MTIQEHLIQNSEGKSAIPQWAKGNYDEKDSGNGDDRWLDYAKAIHVLIANLQKCIIINYLFIKPRIPTQSNLGNLWFYNSPCLSIS